MRNNKTYILIWKAGNSFFSCSVFESSVLIASIANISWEKSTEKERETKNERNQPEEK